MKQALAVLLTLLAISAGLPAALLAQTGDTAAPVKKPVTLPWRTATGNGAAGPAGLSPQAMLKLVGIDEHEFAHLHDGRTIAGDEDSTLAKILYRLPRYDPPQWERWCTQPPAWSALRSAPAQHRGDCFLIRGRATHVERIALTPEQAARFEFSHYYRVTVVADEQTEPVVIFTRQIPALWQDATTLNEPVRVQAMFLKLGEAVDGSQPYYFAAARLAWYPDQVNPALGVTPDLVWLAARGMDIALWDTVRERSGLTVSAEEGECFYQLLETLRQVTPDQTPPMPTQPFNLVGMLQKPQALLGQAYAGLGVARRIQKVKVPERYRQRLGLDHYYEIDLFIPLDKQQIRLAKDQTDANAPTFTDGFPTTLCVARLPTDLSEGTNIKEAIRFEGIFFKQWAYSSDFLKQFDKNIKQPAPLLIGLEPQLVKSEPPFDTSFVGPGALMVVIVLAIAVLWIATWMMSRGDLRYQQRVLKRITSRGPGNSEEIAGSDNPSLPGG